MTRSENQARSIKDRLNALAKELKIPFQNVMTELKRIGI